MTRLLAIGLAVALACCNGSAQQELEKPKPVSGQDAPVAVVDWSKAGDYVGKTITITGTVARTHNSGKVVFLNFTEDWKGTFSAAIFAATWADFPKPPEELFLHKAVRVTGKVKMYKGSPEIVVDTPEQITWGDGKPVVSASNLPPIPLPGPRSAGLRIVSWNIENFFDRFDDPYTRDEVTDPATVSKRRKRRVAAGLLLLNADVVCVQEVENRAILSNLNEAYLKELGYEVVLFEGNDGRGIDVAVLTRVPVVSVTSYRHLDFTDAEGQPQRFRRDLLRVRLGGAFDGDVYVVHLKSQGGGDEADVIREAEAAAASAILAAEMKADPNYRAMIAGDFNEVADQPTVQAFLAAGMVDPHAGSKQYSYNQKPYLTRIDFTLCTPALAKDLVSGSAKIGPELAVLKEVALASASDHYPVVVELKPTAPATPGD